MSSKSGDMGHPDISQELLLLAHHALLTEPGTDVGCLSHVISFVQDHEVDGPAELAVGAGWAGLGSWSVEQLFGCGSHGFVQSYAALIPCGKDF